MSLRRASARSHPPPVPNHVDGVTSHLGHFGHIAAMIKTLAFSFCLYCRRLVFDSVAQKLAEIQTLGGVGD